jgi:hypothetical protein
MICVRALQSSKYFLGSGFPLRFIKKNLKGLKIMTSALDKLFSVSFSMLLVFLNVVLVLIFLSALINFIKVDFRHVIYPAGFKFSRFGEPFPSAPLKIKISRRFKISKKKKKKFERHISDFRMLTGKNPRLPKVCHFLLLIFCHRQLTLHTGLHRYCTVNTELSKISR